MLTCLLTGYQLQWYMNGIAIPGANLQTYEITQDGVYSVVAKNNFGCKRSSSPNYIAYTSPAGLEEIGLLNNVIVYPNPAEEDLNLIVNEKIIGYNYILSDFIGRVLQKGIINEVELKLSLNGYNKGLYFLSIEGVMKKTFKVVKN